MEQEKPSERPLQTPPKWWHDAIRNTLPGNLINQNLFISFPQSVDSNISFLVISKTKIEMTSSNYPEGIFIETTIPEAKSNEAAAAIIPILSPIKAAIIEEAKKIDTTDSQDLPSLGASFSALTSIKISFGIKSPEHTLVLSLHPVSADEIKESKFFMPTVKEKIVDDLFANSDVATRIKFLFNPTAPTELKSEIVKRESTLYKITLQEMLNKNFISEKELEMVQKSDLAQENYLQIMNGFSKIENASEARDLLVTLSRMSHQELAGWILFYSRYWQERLPTHQN